MKYTFSDHGLQHGSIKVYSWMYSKTAYQKMQVDGIFCNLAKAFDCVDNEILLRLCRQ
jgi:hypothetical protein